MAYLRTITRASRNFEGAGWASYDMAFSHQVANQCSLDWGVIDSALYNEAFTGQVRLIPRCRFCLADSHYSRECTFGPEERYLPAQAPYSSTHREQRSVQICQLFNKPRGNACRYKRHCRYVHLCAKCHRGPHPATECTARYGLSPSPKESLWQAICFKIRWLYLVHSINYLMDSINYLMHSQTICCIR